MLPSSIALLPHPPEFLSCFDDLNDGNQSVKTREIYEEILKTILNDKPSTIVIIQSHGGIHPEGVSFHVPEGQQYDADYTAYGHEEENFSVLFDQSLAHYMQKSLHEYGRNAHIIEQPLLSLPALILADMCRQLEITLPRLVVLGVSLEGAQAHYEYGSLIARAIAADKDPIAIVLSGQLSHCLTKESVAGYVPIAKNFDIQIQKYLKDSAWEKLMNVDPFEIQEVGEDVYRPLMFGLGLLDALQQDTKWDASSYEASHGIGYLCGMLKRVE
jgi:aromatic ring-opening dioxygenase LigB subunit